MRFLVTRTSSHNFELKPCEGAVQGPFTRVDMRTWESPEKIPAGMGGAVWWESEGTNHRNIKVGRIRYIARDFQEQRWYVELATLDDVMAFIDKYGACIIEPCFQNSDVMEIEIYDGYRE